MQYLALPLLTLFPVALAWAAVSDLTTMTIPNRLVLAVAVLFVVMAPLAGLTFADAGMHLVAGTIVLAVGFACFAFGWIGGGDAKFAAAVALFLGPQHALSFIALASVFGGVLTLVLLGFRQTAVPASIIRQPWVQRLHDSSTGVPYGVALAASAGVIYPHSVWIGILAG